MGISPDMEAWKARFAICLLIALSALLLTGAREVTREWVRHDSHLAAVNQEALNWVVPAAPHRTEPGAVPRRPSRRVSLRNPRTWARPQGTGQAQPHGPKGAEPSDSNRSHLADHALFLAEACARPVRNP